MGKSKKKSKGKGKKTKSKSSKSKKCCEGEKLCENMDITSKISYLVELGILQDIDSCEPIEFEEFIGDIDYIGSLKDNINPVDIQPQPTLATARQFSIEFGTLPLGSKYLRSKMKAIIPSILLYGPSGSGKSFLSQCIAHSTSSRWFDLSPNNIIENNPELTDTKELSKIIHLTFEIAQYLQPSIVYIDEIEKIFISSKKKDVLDAGKIKKDLLSHCSSKINVENRILIIGNSSCPFNDNIDSNEFKKFFHDDTFGDPLSRMCYIPYPNYLNRQRLWTYFINEGGIHIEELNKHSSFSLSTLSLLSEGYTAGCIKYTVDCVLNEKRFEKYNRLKKPFTTKEFLKALSKTTYTYKDNLDLFSAFTAKVTGRSKSVQKIKEKQAAAANPDAGGDGKKDKKGKKGGKKKK